MERLTPVAPASGVASLGEILPGVRAALSRAGAAVPETARRASGTDAPEPFPADAPEPFPADAPEPFPADACAPFPADASGPVPGDPLGLADGPLAGVRRVAVLLVD